MWAHVRRTDNHKIIWQTEILAWATFLKTSAVNEFLNSTFDFTIFFRYYVLFLARVLALHTLIALSSIIHVLRQRTYNTKFELTSKPNIKCDIVSGVVEN